MECIVLYIIIPKHVLSAFNTMLPHLTIANFRAEILPLEIGGWSQNSERK